MSSLDKFIIELSCEDIFVAAARKEFEYMMKTTYLNLVYSTLYMSLYTPSTHYYDFLTAFF